MNAAMRGRRSGIRATRSAALGAAAALLLPAPASADGADDAFIAALQQHGIAYTNRDATAAAGRGVCDWLDQGLSPAVIILTVRKRTNLSAHTAAYFFGAAVTSYCPQYSSDIDNSAP